MNKYLAVLVAAIALVGSGFATAGAGVVLTETETTVSGQPSGQPPQARSQTMMIQGNKQKTIIDGGRTIITDLDKGTTTIINPAQKNYFERPFPPPGAMGAPAGSHAATFTKTGKTRTVSGYKCEDYNGEGKFSMGNFTVVSCVSTAIPGAAEFTTFQKKMTSKLKDTQFAMPTNLPDGIPLEQNTTTKMSVANMPNLPPAAAEQLKKQFANRPPIVSKIEITKVESKNIPDSEFEIPAGYTKREPMMAHPPGMGMGHGMSGGSSSSGNLGGGATAGDAPLTVAPPPAKP